MSATRISTYAKDAGHCRADAVATELLGLAPVADRVAGESNRGELLEALCLFAPGNEVEDRCAKVGRFNLSFFSAT